MPIILNPFKQNRTKGYYIAKAVKNSSKAITRTTNNIKDLLFFMVVAITIVFCISMLFSSYKSVSANNGICTSAKCEARLERLVTCEKFTKNKDDVLQCALWKTVFLRKDPVDRFEKEEIKQEISNLYDLQNKKVEHIGWDKDDKKQEILNKLYIEGEKQGVKNISDMLGTFLGENGNLNMKQKSYGSYIRNGKKYYDYGLCQISEYYHPKIVNDKRFFTDMDFQIENCVRLYKGGTKFYGAKHKEKMKKFLVYNQK